MYKKVLGLQQSRLWKFADKFNEYVLSTLSILIIVIMFAAVIARYVFHHDIYGNEEIILMLSWWLYFVGAMNGSLEDSQIKAEMMDMFLKNQKLLMVIKGTAKLLETFVFGVCSYMAIDLVAQNIVKNPTTAGLKIPFWIPQLAIAIGFVFMTIYTLYWAVLYYSAIKEEGKTGKEQE